MSSRITLAAFVLSATAWLVAGSVLALLASIKLHMPDFFAGSAWLTFGRVRPAHAYAGLHGWASLAGVGTLLWLLVQTGGNPLPHPRLLLGACVLWNVAVGVTATALLGGSNDAAGLWPAICGGVLVLIAFAALRLTGRRKPTTAAQWYLLAAAGAYPFAYLATSLLVYTHAARGLVHALLTAWFERQVLILWLTPIGLAAMFYLIPTLAQRPLYSRPLAVFGFWAWVLLAPWSGPQRLAGTPLPAWTVAVGALSTLLLLVPAAAVAVNLHRTLRGAWGAVRRDVGLRFVVLGALCFSAASVQDAVQALPAVDAVTHFTQCGVAQTHLGVYGFFTLVMFGATYHLLPRLRGRAAPPRYLMELHFACAAGGLALYWLGLLTGGIVQGLALRRAETPFTEVVGYLTPFFGVRSVAAYLMLTGHLVFAWCVLRQLARRGVVSA